METRGNPGIAGASEGDSERCDQAAEAKLDFQGNVLTYLLVNAILWGIWAFTGAESRHRPLADLGRRDLGDDHVLHAWRI